MDDSGFVSPTKCASDDNVMFYLKLGNSDHRMVSAGQQDMLAYCLTQTYSKKNIENFLVWAKIRGPNSEPKSVNPCYLPCGFIEPSTDVELEEMREAGQNLSKLLESKTVPKLQTGMQNTSVFFISISNREKMERITKVHYKNLRYRDMCVVAYPGQSYRDAITSDGRFTNVDRFTLERKVPGAKGSAMDMDLKPGDFKEEMTFIVKVRRVVQSSQRSSTTAVGSGPASTSTCQTETEKQTVTKSPQTKKSYNTLVEKLWRDNSVYLFSKDTGDLTNEEIREEMLNCLKARGWCTLVGPTNREPKKYETSLQELAKHEFANENVVSRPVRVTKKLMELYNSVALLKCDSVVATCSLMRDNIILTNWHVVDKILKARNSSTHYHHRDVYVLFDLEDADFPEYRQYKLKDLSCPDNIICEGFDYAFLYLEEHVLGVLPLADFVSCKVPERGVVCIAGHPYGNEKEEEVCPILPLHDDRRAHDLERRFQENQLNCRNNQSGCALSYARQYTGKCVHSYEKGLQALCSDENRLTYDVGSMFEGSSGAPVFDMKLRIVALHSGGFCLGQTSVVEYGATFDAIIRNLKATGHSEFVCEHFSHCSDDDMDTSN